MTFSVWKAGAFCHPPGVVSGRPPPFGCRCLRAPREQSGADLPSFCVNRFSALEWHLSGQLKFSDSCHLWSGSVQTPCPLTDVSPSGCRAGAGVLCLYTFERLHPERYLYLSHNVPPPPTYLDEVSCKLFQQMPEYPLCARPYLVLSKAKWK